jgi:hypothetical protein
MKSVKHEIMADSATTHTLRRVSVKRCRRQTAQFHKAIFTEAVLLYSRLGGSLRMDSVDPGLGPGECIVKHETRGRTPTGRPYGLRLSRLILLIETEHYQCCLARLDTLQYL